MSSSLLNLLFVQAWQIAAIAGFVWLLTKCFGRTRSRLSHGLWLLVLLKCVTPPIWGHDFAVFSHAQRAIMAKQQDFVEPFGFDQSTMTVASAEFVEYDTTVHPDVLFSMARASEGVLVPDEALSEFREPEPSIAPAIVANEAIPSVTDWSVVCYALAVGMGISFLLIWLRYVQCLRRIRQHRVTDFDDALTTMVRRLCWQLNVRRVPRVIVSDVLFGPAVFGILRPTIVLPRCLLQDEDNANSLTPILAHELLHIRRGDLLTGTLQALVQCLWWFHPFVWLVNRLLSRETERCCDEEVVAELGCSPADYARSLLSVIESKQPLQAVPVFPGMKPVEITSQRMERIMSLKNGSRKRMPLLHWLVVVAMALFTLPGAAISDGEGQDDNEEGFNLSPPAANRKSAPPVLEAHTAQTVDTTNDVDSSRKSLEQRINKALDERVSLHFDDLELTGLLRLIATKHNLNIVLDTRAAEGRANAYTQSFSMNQDNIRLRDALAILLKFNNLTYSVEREVLKITDAKPGEKVAIDGGNVHVLGMVMRPGSYWINKATPTTVFDMIAQAGGLKDGASDRIVLRRHDTKKNGALVSNVMSDAEIKGTLIHPLNGSDAVFLSLSLDKAGQQKTQQVAVAPGDIITIASQPKVTSMKTAETVAGRVDDLSFDVAPNARIVGREIILGKSVSDEVAAAIKTQAAKLVKTQPRYLKKNVTAEVKSIITLLREHGYFDVKIDVEPRFSRDRQQVSMTYKTYVGEQYRIRQVKVAGVNKSLLDKVMAKSKLQRSKAFSKAALSHDTDAVLKRMSEHGFFFAKVTPCVVFTTKVDEIDIVLDVERGKHQVDLLPLSNQLMFHVPSEARADSTGQKKHAEKAILQIPEVMSVKDRLVVPVDAASNPRQLNVTNGKSRVLMLTPAMSLEEVEEELILGTPTSARSTDAQQLVTDRPLKKGEVQNPSIASFAEAVDRPTSADDAPAAMQSRAYNVADLVVTEAPIEFDGMPNETVSNALAATKANPNESDATVPKLIREQNPILQINAERSDQKKTDGVDFTPLTELIRTSVAPESWSSDNNGPVIESNQNTLSLIVWQTSAAHDEIVELLQALRQENDSLVVCQCTVLYVPAEKKIDLETLGVRLNASKDSANWALMHTPRIADINRNVLNAGARVIIRPQFTAMPEQAVSLKFATNKTDDETNAVNDGALQLTARPLPNGDLLRLNYKVELPNLTDALDGQILIKSAQTLILECLPTKNVGVPLLDKVPNTSRIFRNTPQGRVLIVITPRIVRDED